MTIKIVFVGIAGTDKDFLLSSYVLKAYVSERLNDVDVFVIDIPYDRYQSTSGGTLKREVTRIVKNIRAQSPDVVGFSCYVWNIDLIKEISNELAASRSGCKIVIGGPQISEKDILAGRLDFLRADYFVVGEGEKPFLELLKGKNPTDIKSLLCKQNGKWVYGGACGPIDNLKTCGSPYLEGHVPDSLLKQDGIRLSIETQRGCNLRCSYCFYHKFFPTIRYRDPAVVVDEFVHAHALGVSVARILDANFVSDREFASAIMKGLIDKDVKMSIITELIPNMLNEYVAGLFGAYQEAHDENRIIVGIGIQSINEDSLKAIRRNISVKVFERAFSMLQKNNVIIKSDIILGLPKESKVSYERTLEWITEKMRHGSNHLALAVLRVLPGTEMVDIACAENMVTDNRGYSDYVYSSPTMTREDLLDCVRLNAVANRLLNTWDMEERIEIRNSYFKTKDALKATNMQMLNYFVKVVFDYLMSKGIDHFAFDMPNPEFYEEKAFFSDVPNRFLMEHLTNMKPSELLLS